MCVQTQTCVYAFDVELLDPCKVQVKKNKGEGS